MINLYPFEKTTISGRYYFYYSLGLQGQNTIPNCFLHVLSSEFKISSYISSFKIKSEVPVSNKAN